MADSPKHHDRVKRLFAEAFERETHERSQYLAEACGDDADLLAEVESLLSNHDEAHAAEFLRQPACAEALAKDVKLQPSQPQASTSNESQNAIPDRIDQYKIEKVLGAGRFGVVYLAYDEVAERHVAIKVPHSHLIKTPQDVDVVLAEARMQAQLEHPSVVPFYHASRTDDGSCFFVSKYIEGTNLKARIEQEHPTRETTIDIVITIAEALHAAHKKGLVHRDVKPANILINKSGHPFLADFGLAIHEDHQRLLAGQVAGAPAYMAPE